MEVRNTLSSDIDTKLCLPLIMRIGVTGHRTLPDEQIIHESVKRVLIRIDEILISTPHAFIAVSPIAEGADRLVANDIINWPVPEKKNESKLEVVLPMPEEDYLQDFNTQESQEEFKNLLRLAITTQILNKKASRSDTYNRAGQFVVQNCDVLIAIWDGNPAKGAGGTADIVEYARKAGRYIFWINSNNGEINEEGQFDTNLIKSINTLKEYNSEKLHHSDLSSAINTQYEYLENEAITVNLSPNLLEPLREHLLPQFVRADLLAQRYQSRYMKTGIAVYALATIAVATVTIQTLFYAGHPEILLLEVAGMAIIIILLLISHKGEWHRKWIDYRFLAERLRAALFLSIANIECEPPKPLSHLSISHQPDEWMVRAFTWIWKQPHINHNVPFEPMKKFLSKAWINDQISYYSKNSKFHKRMHDLLYYTGLLFFGLTFIAALFHFIGEFFPQFHFAPHRVLVSLAIILPASGAALAGIRVHREHLRNAEQYNHMQYHLAEKCNQINEAKDMVELTDLLEGANEIMLRENQDWRVVFLFQKLEAP
jgi:hypothetical protein